MPQTYIRAALIAFVVALFPAGYLKGCSDEKAKFDQYKGAVEALGQAAEKAAKARADRNKANQEKADAENFRSRSALARAVAELRARRPGGGFLPPAAPAAGRPDIASFERAELERAIRALDSEVQGLVDEGSQAVIDLDTAKGWAQAP